jgi:hypothetical protein
MRIEVTAVRLSRPPLFESRTDVMRHLGHEVPWLDRTRAAVPVRQRTRLLRAIDDGAERLGLKVRESGVGSVDTRPSDPPSVSRDRAARSALRSRSSGGERRTAT